MLQCLNHEDCIDNALQNAYTICNNKKLQFTKLRRLTLEIIWSNHYGAKAYDILDDMRVEKKNAKPSTVYRCLNFLLANGLIHKLESLHLYVGCSHPLEHSECCFLICNICKKVTECCNQELSEAISKTTVNNHFNTEKITVELEGKCKNCQTKSNRQKA